ncbi:MAG: HAD family hydrolase [Candidatus Heimdallarchaeaceae archaeon]
MTKIKCGDKVFRDIELVAFDKDGTLLTFDMFLPVMIKRAELLIERYNLPSESFDEIIELMGIDPIERKVVIGGAIHTERVTIIKQTQDYLHQYNQCPSVQELAKLFDEVDAQVDFYNHAKPYDGVPETLRKLRDNGLILLVITHDSTEPAIKQLKSAGIADYFDLILGLDFDSPYNPKPSPDMLLYGSKVLGVDISKTIIVGDDNRDMLTGKNAGALGAVGVLSGRSKAEELPDADVIIDSVADIEV